MPSLITEVMRLKMPSSTNLSTKWRSTMHTRTTMIITTKSMEVSTSPNRERNILSLKQKCAEISSNLVSVTIQTVLLPTPKKNSEKFPNLNLNI